MIPAPDVTPDMAPFWDAAQRGVLYLKTCDACGRPHWYPRAICPFCSSVETSWGEASGRGMIYSYSVVRRAAEPYVLAIVTLEEGVAMLTNIVDCDPDALAIGQSVVVSFRDTTGPPVPMFVPA